MNVFDLDMRLVERYQEFTRSFTSVRSLDLKAKIDEIYGSDAFWPEPLIGLNPNFRPAQETLEALAAKGAVDAVLPQIFAAGDPRQPIRLHRHQEQALSKAQQRKNFIVTTGTGSGKSLCFFVPIINRILRARRAGEPPRTRAIIIYPMNALANSQREELEKFIGEGGLPDEMRPTFRRYTGQEQESERRAAAIEKPDIILTNFMMLELLMTRQDELDRSVMENMSGLEFLVLDELHTYRGRQGADVAMLVRRVRERVGSQQMLCIGTSATMASGEEDAGRRAVADVGTRLFGSAVSPDDVITETLERRTVKPANEAEYLRALQAAVTNPPQHATAEAFETDPLAVWIEENVGLDLGETAKRRPPMTLTQAAENLGTQIGLGEDACRAALIQHLVAMSDSKGGSDRAFMAFKLHRFIAGAGHAHATLEPADHRTVSLSGEKFDRETPDARLYPLFFCRECGQEVHSVSIDDEGQVLPRSIDVTPEDEPDLEGNWNGFLVPDAAGDLDFRGDIEDYPDAWLEEGKSGLRLKASHRGKHEASLMFLARDGREKGEEIGVRSWFFPGKFRFCPHCRYEPAPQARDINKLSGLSSEGRSSATTMITTAALDWMDRAQTPKDKHRRKLLGFTDNRQDAALQAGHFNDFIFVTLLRGAMLRAVEQAGPEGLIRERIADNRLPMTSLFEELLRTVYRLIFLAVAEDRDLLHPRSVLQRARALYAANYSFTFWRERSRRRVARDHHHDAWEGMKITLAALEHGEQTLGLPALGGLFARGATPTLKEARIPNRCFLEAVFNLGFIRVEGSLHRINWRDMKTEELGSVYESLLEIRPYLAPNGDFVLDSGAKGNARKTSGSYYTPDSLVETLLDSALDPVVEKAEANAETPAEKAAAVLNLRVIDPACGSGHFLLGAARRMADRVALWRDPDAGKEEKQAALRDVVSRCIHGTDRNPMAVELAKVALWIESVSPGQPLGFLDANIRCGDALLGVFDLAVLEEGIPDEAYRPLIGDSKDAAKYYGKLNKDAKKGQGQLDFHGGGGAMPPRKLAANLATIKRMPEDTVRQVEEKKRLFEAWRHDPARYATKVACDLYIAAFLLPKTEVPDVRGRDMVPTTADVRCKLAGGTNYGPMEAVAIDAAEAARSLHWPLAFPDIIVERGGFDVVLGNPPWERIEVQEQEFFSSSHPAIAGAQNAAKRRTMIEALESEEPATFAAWRQALRAAAVEVAYYKGSARFPLGSTGKINTYAVFADLFRQAVNKKGRSGLILPSGLVNGFTYREFLAHLLKTKTIASFYGFENEEKIFKSVHNETKFGVLTLTGEMDPVEQPWFTAHLRQPSQINDPERRYALSIGEIEAINPNTLNLPAFRWAMDAEVTAAIHNAAPVLIRKEPDAQIESPWQISLATLFNMATDSGKFLDHADVASLIVERRDALAMLSDGREVYPLYEGKMFWHFDHRYGTYEGQTEKQANKGVLPRTSDSQHSDQSYRVEPLYWVEAALTNDILGNRAKESSFFSWRDVGPSERTFVGTVIPKTAVGHAAPILLTSETGNSRAALYATLSSLVVDYAARQKSNRMTFSSLSRSRC